MKPVCIKDLFSFPSRVAFLDILDCVELGGVWVYLFSWWIHVVKIEARKGHFHTHTYTVDKRGLIACANRAINSPHQVKCFPTLWNTLSYSVCDKPFLGANTTPILEWLSLPHAKHDISVYQKVHKSCFEKQNHYVRRYKVMYSTLMQSSRTFG